MRVRTGGHQDAHLGGIADEVAHHRPQYRVGHHDLRPSAAARALLAAGDDPRRQRGGGNEDEEREKRATDHRDGLRYHT
jgi:hypothetical protein